MPVGHAEMTDREVAVENAVEQMKAAHGTAEQPGMRAVAERYVADWEAQGFDTVASESQPTGRPFAMAQP